MSNRSYDKKILTTFVSHNLDFIYLVIPIFLPQERFFIFSSIFTLFIYLFLFILLNTHITTALTL